MSPNTKPLRIALKNGHAQSKRLRRNAANPEPHPLDSDFDEASILSIFLGGKIANVSVFLPKRSELEGVPDEPGSSREAGNGIVAIVLKDSGSVPRICNLARPEVGQKPNGPIAVAFARENAPMGRARRLSSLRLTSQRY
jgi:hypothetical protein